MNKIVDFHVHTFPKKIAEVAVSKLAAISMIVPATDGTDEMTLEVLKSAGVDSCVTLNIATSPKQQTAVNNSALEVKERYRGRIFPFGSVHFEAENALEELTRIKEIGLYGVKLHPDYQGFMIDDKRLFPIYDLCQQLMLPVVFHAGWDCYSPGLIHAPPVLSAKVLKEFPNLKMVLAHFGGLKMWGEVETELIGKNVWLDTAMCASYAEKSMIKRLIEKHDISKVLFGSDCPWENPKNAVEFVNSMGFSQDKLDKILFENAKNLLSI